MRGVVEAKTPEERHRLGSQTRDDLTCGFFDMEKDCCSVYDVRPALCRVFGLTAKLPCPVAPPGFVLTISPAKARVMVDMDTLDFVMLTTEWKWSS